MYDREYYRRNRERILARRRAYREAHRDIYRAASRKWQQENRKHIRAYRRKYDEENRERITSQRKARWQAAIDTGEPWHCHRCNKDKPASDFYYSVPGTCKACRADQRKAK